MDRHCADISIGGKYTIRFKPLVDKLEENEEVAVAELIHIKPPNCNCSEAKLLRLEEKGESRYHPIWLVDCHECPFYRKPGPHDAAADRSTLSIDVRELLQRVELGGDKKGEL